MAGKAALALNLKISNESIFARKNYFYPDLPKDNQTFVFERPQAESGASAHSEMFGLRNDPGKTL
jgi:aspartyl-tRNA(Asn)/glutamyl-tRNA(Gln) amidotransferase subunit B